MWRPPISPVRPVPVGLAACWRAGGQHLASGLVQAGVGWRRPERGGDGQGDRDRQQRRVRRPEGAQRDVEPAGQGTG